MIVKVGGIEIDPAKTPFNMAAAKSEKEHTCQQYALFFQDMSSTWVFLAFMFFAVLSIIFTICIRNITPGIERLGPPPLPQATSTDIEATAIPGDASAGAPTESDNPEEGDEPPPYQPPATETTPQTTPKPPVKRSSAQRFVIGTCLLVCDIAALFLLALSIQSVVFCQDWSPIGTCPRLIWWALFSGVAIWATFGASCWLILLRDLWGPGMRKKYPIKEHAIAFTLCCIAVSPFVLLWMVFGVGSVRVVEACQRRFCGDALEEGEDFELAGGSRPEERDEDEVSEGGADEDMVMLMEGHK